MKIKREILSILLLCSALIAAAQTDVATQEVNIWEGTDTKAVTMIAHTLKSGKPHMAVIVLPGGSYFWHDMQAEGAEVAAWLNAHGIAAFVLRYRTAYVPAFLFRYRWVARGNRFPDPQNDLWQALQLVRQRAWQYNINPNSVGVMGFSAGGHLAMSAAELFQKEDRPNFIAALYPVVTMEEPYVHKRSRRALMGENRVKDVALRDTLSMERHVPKDCPPVFLANCEDDPTVDYHNSIMLDSALTAQGVPHVYYRYKTGGHGFGASDEKGSEETRTWKNSFIRWIKETLTPTLSL